jgi:hypothetical protein
LLQAAVAQDFEVEASVNANKLGIDDNLQLTVSIKGDTLGRAGQPQLPKLDGFRVGGQSTSTNIQWINGQMSSTRSIIYTLLPREEGEFVIGPITVEYQGEEYLTEPIEVEVVSGSILQRGGGPGGRMDPFDMLSPFRRRRQRPEQQQGEIFVTAELSRRNAYVGEQVVLTYKLYSQVRIMGLQVDEQPQLTGFWVEDVELPDEPQIRETEVDGKPFFVVEIKKNILFPTRSGNVEIGRAVFSMGVEDPSSDPFFGSMTQTVRRSTQTLTLEVKPLPAVGKPADFSGAVGQFKLSAELDKEETTAGDPLTLSVVLEGQGNLRTVDPPKLPSLPGFRTYDPETEENTSTRNGRFGGNKKWEYVLVPDSAGRTQIGPLAFSYFDPAKKRYVELQAGPVTLDVAAATGVAGGAAVSSRGAVQVLRQDIRYLKPAPEELGMARSPFYETWLFFATLALPIVWNLGLVAYRMKRQSEAAHEGLWRARRARKMAQGRLKNAHKLARVASKDFYEETASALYAYVADKLGVSPSGLTTKNIDSMMEERRIPEAERKAFIDTIESCEFARFTPGERSREEMESLLDRAEKIIVALEKYFG